MAWKTAIERRRFLRGIGFAGAVVRIGLPPLEAMLNSSGTAYAAPPGANETAQPLPARFVLWFNGNGVPERVWIPAETGPDYAMTPCLTPLVPFRNNVHILSGLDNPAARGLYAACGFRESYRYHYRVSPRA